MKSKKIDPVAVRNQVFLLEKAISSLRYSMDMTIAENPDANRRMKQTVHVPSSLEDFLTASNEIEQTHGSNYHLITEGVWVSYQRKGSNGVEYRSVGLMAEGMEGYGASCLAISPVFDPEGRTDWLTVDTAFDLQALRNLTSAKISLVCGFRDIDPTEYDVVGRLRDNFSLTIRVLYEDTGKFEDLKLRSFPTIEAPLPFEFEIPPKVLERLNDQPSNSGRILIDLPVNLQRKYEFMISAFRIEGAAV